MEFAQGKNIPRVNAPSTGPPTIPNIPNAAYKDIDFKLGWPFFLKRAFTFCANGSFAHLCVLIVPLKHRAGISPRIQLHKRGARSLQLNLLRL